MTLSLGLNELASPPTPEQLRHAYLHSYLSPAVRIHGTWVEMRNASGAGLDVSNITAIYIARPGENAVPAAVRAQTAPPPPPASIPPPAAASPMTHIGYVLRRLLTILCLFAVIHAYIFGSATVAAHALSAAYLLNRQAVALFPRFPDFTRRPASPTTLPEASLP